MDTDQIISKLRESEHPWEGDGLPNEVVGGNNVVLELDHDQDKLYTAILKTIPKDVLAGIARKLAWEPGSAASLVNKIEWLSREHPKEVASHNEPITTLLKLYLNKRSKRVVHARLQLKDRFSKQSYRDQNRILRAFLKGAASDREWACRILRDNWRKELARDIEAAWTESPNPMLAFVILRHFPNTFILREQERLAQTASYPHVCARVGNEPSFAMDESRLDVLDYLYVMAKLGRSVDSAEVERRLYSFLLDYDGYYDGFFYTTPSFSSIEGWDRMVWAMGVLGMQDALVRLLDFENRVKETARAFDSASASNAGPENKWFQFFAAVKETIEPEGLPERLNKEKDGFRSRHAQEDQGHEVYGFLDEYDFEDGQAAPSVRGESSFYDKCMRNPFMTLQEEWDLFVDCFYIHEPHLSGILKSARVVQEDGIYKIVIHVQDRQEEFFLMEGPLQGIINSFAEKTTFDEKEYRIILRPADNSDAF